MIQRLQETAFDPKGTRLLPYVHVLDLAEDGFIKPHIDSIRVSIFCVIKLRFLNASIVLCKISFNSLYIFQFCGDTVAIISLLSDCVLKLVHETNEDYYAHCMIPRRSLYILR